MGHLYENLHADGLISDESFKKIKQKHDLFSVHWEVKTLLYLGVSLLTSGLGLLIYENIDTIGHKFVLAVIALICTGCFVYCFKAALPFSSRKVKSPNALFDYVLLLGSISFLTFIGYLQYEYKLFGANYNLATLIPMLLLFFTAYYFDHPGILNMAIANLAVWMGVSVTPKTLLLNCDFDSQSIIFTYLVLGIILLASAYLTQRLNFKKHFKFSYQHYGVHVTLISLLAGYFFYYNSAFAMSWMLLLFAVTWVIFRDAFKNHSFYFLLLAVLYSYLAVSSLVVRVMMLAKDEGALYLTMLYFIGSAIGLIFLLINLNKKLKAS
jgi:hypothetical protein